MYYPRNTGRRPLDFQNRTSAPAPQTAGRMPVAAAVTEPTCPELSSQPLSLAMAYIPFQSFDGVLEPDQALAEGTLFEALDLPFYGQRRRA